MTNAVPDLKEVLVTDHGDRWIEIDSPEAADYAGLLTQTAVGHFYKQEARLEGGAHPRRWFVLSGPDESGKVIGKVSLCVLPEGVETAAPEFVSDCHTTGYQNRPPYPDFADEIEALSEAIGIELPPNYQGRPVAASPGRAAPSP